MNLRRKQFAFAFILALAPLALGQSTTSAPSSHAPQKPRKDIAGAGNLAQVSPALYRGQQPTKEGFENLKKLGVKTIIDLRDSHDDAPLIKGTGLNLVRIPCTASKFTEADILTFFKTVQDPANQPVYVHCERGADRTGLMVACYHMAEQGWTVDEAVAELPNFKYDKSKTKVMDYIKAFDPAKLKQELPAAPAPKIEHVE